MELSTNTAVVVAHYLQGQADGQKPAIETQALVDAAKFLHWYATEKHYASFEPTRRDEGGPVHPLTSDERWVYAKHREDLANPNLDAAERESLQAEIDAMSGITLRDEFAGRAMQGLIADGHTMWDHPKLAGDPDAIAEFAYRQADAMLRARKA